jgi:hypothetical protein
MIDLLETVYGQGKKDGMREAVATFENAAKTLPYKNPGRPKGKGKRKLK